jgi:hypothetical protein
MNGAAKAPSAPRAPGVEPGEGAIPSAALTSPGGRHVAGQDKAACTETRSLAVTSHIDLLETSSTCEESARPWPVDSSDTQGAGTGKVTDSARPLRIRTPVLHSSGAFWWLE